MQEHEVRELMDRLLEAMDPALEYEARHEDYVVEFPQSGERLNRDGLRAMQEAYPNGPPKIHLSPADRRRAVRGPGLARPVDPADRGAGRQLTFPPTSTSPRSRTSATGTPRPAAHPAGRPRPGTTRVPGPRPSPCR